MDRALEADQQEAEEDFLSSQGPLYAETMVERPQKIKQDEELGEEEE